MDETFLSKDRKNDPTKLKSEREKGKDWGFVIT